MGQQSLDQLSGWINSVLQGDPVGSQSMAQITAVDRNTYQLKVFDLVNRERFTGAMRMLDPTRLEQELWFDLQGGVVRLSSSRQRRFYNAVPRQVYQLVLGRRHGGHKTSYELVRVIKQSSLHELV